ncbi:hypothetical protein FACS1894201_05430 [Bacteroidia bacterium]|nr:hypothetical protein FACS1894201_05430 [Bacteroidia bacterium]
MKSCLLSKSLVYGMLTIALLAALSACNKKPGSIHGKVTDKFTGASIVDANVQLNPKGLSYVTTSEGQYGFLDVKAGKYTLAVTKTGYVDITNYSVSVNAEQATYSNVQMVSIMPVLSTQAGTIDYVAGTTTATFNGTIIHAGDPAYTERGFVYDTSTNPDIEHGTKHVVQGTDVSNYSATLTGLPMGSAYYYVRAYATNSQGTVYGSQVGVAIASPNTVGMERLMVQKQDIGRDSYIVVNSLCENSTVDGFTDWRLPTKDELNVLYINRNEIGGFETSYLYPCLYWSGPLFRDSDGDRTWIQSFDSGQQFTYRIIYRDPYGRCVRKYR